MKKSLLILLALALVMSLSISVLAATNNGGATNIPVKGIYASGDEVETVSVDITWGDMNFTYTEGSATWNPATHTATEGEGTWRASGNTVTVTNHSNTAVKATMTFAPASGLNVTGSFNQSELNLASAVNTTYAAAPAATATLTIKGSIAASTDNLGTITVTIEKA